MPTWAKALMGCGLLFVLAMGACVGLGVYGFRKVATLGQAQWPRYVETVKALKDPAATKALYEANPNLKERYSDADAFEQKVASWRGSIETPPPTMPSITTGKAMAFEGTKTGEGKTNVAGYKMSGGRMLVVIWRNDSIHDIEFERSRP